MTKSTRSLTVLDPMYKTKKKNGKDKDLLKRFVLTIGGTKYAHVVITSHYFLSRSITTSDI